MKSFAVQDNFDEKMNVLCQIGTGSFSEVYLGQYKKKLQSRKYAIKLIEKETVNHRPTGMQDLINEIQIMNQVKKCNSFVTLNEIYEDE